MATTGQRERIGSGRPVRSRVVGTAAARPNPAGLDAAVANLAGGTVRVAVQIQGIALWTNIS